MWPSDRGRARREALRTVARWRGSRYAVDAGRGPRQCSRRRSATHRRRRSPSRRASWIAAAPKLAAPLSALDLSGVTLAPTFHTDSLNYTLTVAHSVSLTTVNPTTSHDSATVAYVDASDEALTDASTAPGRAVGVLLELEGPEIEAVEAAAGLELYHSAASGKHRIVVAGPLEDGPLLRFRVPDRGRISQYRIRVLQVTGEDFGLRDLGGHRAVISPR